LRENHRRPNEGNTEKNRRNKTDKDRAHVRRVHLPLGNGTNETEVALAATGMRPTMRRVADGKQPGEEQQDREQTRECGVCDPLRVNRFSSFLQALVNQPLPSPERKPEVSGIRCKIRDCSTIFGGKYFVIGGYAMRRFLET
jgi:hypothetical protein